MHTPFSKMALYFILCFYRYCALRQDASKEGRPACPDKLLIPEPDATQLHENRKLHTNTKLASSDWVSEE